jgi:DNA-binding response OmpR family regulator
VGLNRTRNILIVEDSRADVALMRKAMEFAGVDAVFHVADDGEKAVQFFESAAKNPEAPCPDLVILDINLPRYKGGGEVLRRIRASARCADAPVIIVTSSDSSRDREDMDRLGANDYFKKPSEFSEYMKLGQRVRAILGLHPDEDGPAT